MQTPMTTNLPRRLLLSTLRKPWISTLCVVALVAAAAAVAWLSGFGPFAPTYEEGGPIRVPDQHGYVVRYEVGDEFTDGYERVLLTGDQPGVLERIEMVGPHVDHFEVLGVLLAGPNRKTGSVQVYDGFTDRPTDRAARGLGPLIPAEGARLAPGKVGSVLQIGLKVVKPGLAIRTGVRIYYSVGDEGTSPTNREASSSVRREPLTTRASGSSTKFGNARGNRHARSSADPVVRGVDNLIQCGKYEAPDSCAPGALLLPSNCLRHGRPRVQRRLPEHHPRHGEPVPIPLGDRAFP